MKTTLAKNKTKRRERAWLVISSWRGIEFQAKAYRSEIMARRIERLWRQKANPAYDQVDVVRVQIL